MPGGAQIKSATAKMRVSKSRLPAAGTKRFATTAVAPTESTLTIRSHVVDDDLTT